MRRLLLACAILFSAERAHAAIAFGTVGTAATGSTSVDVPYPASISAGDLLVLGICNKYPTNGPSTPDGWTLPANAQGSGGSGSAETDSGTVYATVFYKVAAGDETGNLTVSVPSGNMIVAGMARYTKAADKTWGAAACNGSQNTVSTSWSITTGSNPGITAGDMLVAVAAINADSGVSSSQDITATDATFGTDAERLDSGSGSPGDDADISISDHAVSSGTATAAPVFTMSRNTSGTNFPAGAVAILRLREESGVNLHLLYTNRQQQ